jgi:serine/threonine protein kinase
MPNRLDVKFCRQCGNNLLLVVPPRPTGNLLPMTVLQGRYLIVQHIAKGGMSEIYQARDQQENNRTIAIKELNENQVPLGEREQVMASFRQEAAMLKELEHDNLLHAWEVFEQGGRLYMTMEFLPWQTLEDVLGQASQPLSEDRALDWAAQICDVFSYLHGQKPNKIIYRDLKPGNVMLSPDDDIKLIDFGIARFYKPGKKQDTIQFGTEGYAPPEQYGGAQTCEPADIYALGALLHHLLTLRDPTTKPFYFPPTRQLNNKVSRRVEEAIAQAVNSEPDKRFQSAKEMRQALLGTEATSRPSKPKAKPSSQPSKRKATPSQGKRPQPAASLKVSPRQLTLKAAFAERAQEDIRVELAGSSPASVTASPHWLSVSPAQVKTSAETVTVTRYPRHIAMGHLDMQVQQAEDGPWATLAYYVTLWAAAHARLLVPAETEASGQVTIQQGSEQVSVDVTAVVSPTQEQVTLGWLYVAIAMLVEFGLALAILVSVLTN